MYESKYINILPSHQLYAHTSRREMIKTTLFMLSSCIEMILSQSYISVTFLMIYGAMWSLDMRFDTRFYTMSYVLLNYTRQSSVSYFNYAFRDLLNYLAAQKRIRVRFK
jgi:hypothetical protein